MVLEAGRSKIEVLVDSMSGESPLPGSQMVTLAVSSHPETEGECGQAILSSSYKDIHSIMGVPASWFYLKLIISKVPIRASTCKFRGDTTFSP